MWGEDELRLIGRMIGELTDERKDRRSRSRTMTRLFDSVPAADLYSYFLYWCTQTADGWCWRTVEQIEDYTGYTKSEIATGRSKLKALGVLEEKRVGLPARNYYRLRLDIVAELLLAYTNTLDIKLSGNRPLEGEIVTTGSQEIAHIIGNKELVVGESSKGSSKDSSHPSLSQKSSPAYPVDFESFWKSYPSGHGSKMATFTQWKKLSAEERAILPERLDDWKMCSQWQEEGGRYIKHAERWVRDRFWEDTPPMTKPKSSFKKPNGPDFLGQLRAMQAAEDAPMYDGDDDDVVETTGRVL